MKVFVTGGHGYIGCAVVKALQARGHQVTAMTSKDEHKREVEQKNVCACVGDINKLHELSDKIMEHDLIIHCAFDEHAGADGERKTVEVIKQLFQRVDEKQPNKRFAAILTSGCMVLGNTDENANITEDTAITPPPEMKWRRELEQQFLGLERYTAVVRPAFVWGKHGSHGYKAFTHLQQHNTVQVVGDERNCGKFPWVHVDDLGLGYAILAERLTSRDGDQYAGIYNIVDGRPSLSMADVWTNFVKSANKLLNKNARVEYISLDQARRDMGDFAKCMVLRQGNVRADKIQKLGWNPQHGTPLQEMDQWVKDVMQADERRRQD